MSKREKTEEREKRRKGRLVKKIVIWFVVLAGVSALIFYLVGSAGKNDGDTTDGGIPAVTEGDWVKWNASSQVVLLEYSDFQCPACKSYFPLINAVGEEYGDRVAFVYRHYPIAQIHFNANAAARATEAAGMQGKFWEMHDILFETQELWAPMSASDAASVFAGYARDMLRIDVDKYLVDFDSEAVQNMVTEDFSGAVKAGVNSTPTLYLNGKKIKNPGDIEGFRTLLDEALLNATTNPQ